ncbi:MAG: competence/damage-inducible protein A [Spirosomataceae bacterium]
MNSTIYADIITIGDEILYGQIVDTNSQWMSQELDQLGIRVRRKISVSDQSGEIEDVIRSSAEKVNIILITGGLGPTKDDVTKNTLCQIFNDHLVIEPQAEAFIRAFFESRNRPFTELNRQQAAIPSRCTYLHNATGTAPGMWFEELGCVLVSMPGVPHEMKYLMKQEVLPRLQRHFETPVIHHRVIRTIGIGESFLAERIESWEDNLPNHIKLAYLPGQGQVKLRLTATGQDRDQLDQEIEQCIEALIPLVGEFIFSTQNEELEEVVGKLLVQKQATMGCAESCTGGYLAHSITQVPGSSAYFMGSITSYDNRVKREQLGVLEETLRNYGAVSEYTAREMAEGARDVLGVDYALATTGVAGPTGGSADKPVGTVWIACATPHGTEVKKFQFTQQRATNIRWASYQALAMLYRHLISQA